MFEQNDWLHQDWTKTFHNNNILHKFSHQSKTDSPTKKRILISHRFPRFSPPQIKKTTATTLPIPGFDFSKKKKTNTYETWNEMDESVKWRPKTLDFSQILKKILPRLLNFPPTEGSRPEFRDYLISHKNQSAMQVLHLIAVNTFIPIPQQKCVPEPERNWQNLSLQTLTGPRRWSQHDDPEGFLFVS